MEKLLAVQSELIAPKNQYNGFGKYNYRNAEDILEAVKPLLKKYECSLTISDEMVQVGDRYYIKATCTFSDGENTKEVTAYARESQDFKGMSDAQITGATSSYARKYALNGLFLIDDNKDPDYYDNRTETKVTTKVPTRPNSVMYTSDLKGAKSVSDVESIWFKYKDLHSDSAFIKAVTDRKNELS